jgi:enoyl-CoA hydratase
MSDVVTYRLEDGIAHLHMDDGKVNALSSVMLGEIDRALDRAEADRAVVVVSGREGIFSAGFDLRVLRGGGPDALGMLQAGFRLAERVLSFPLPVVMACPGHAIAMGVFLLLSGDYRIGTRGPFKITANEVAIGLTMPRAAVEITRHRLSPAAFDRAVALAEPFAPDDALAAGFFDRVVEPDELEAEARYTARQLAALDMRAHAQTKARAREQVLRALRAAIEADDAELTGG